MAGGVGWCLVWFFLATFNIWSVTALQPIATFSFAFFLFLFILISTSTFLLGQEN